MHIPGSTCLASLHGIGVIWRTGLLCTRNLLFSWLFRGRKGSSFKCNTLSSFIFIEWCFWDSSAYVYFSLCPNSIFTQHSSTAFDRASRVTCNRRGNMNWTSWYHESCTIQENCRGANPRLVSTYYYCALSRITSFAWRLPCHCTYIGSWCWPMSSMILLYRKSKEDYVLHMKCRLLPIVVVCPSSSSNGTIAILESSMW